MFEKEIKFITDFCLNKISKAGAFLTFEKLKGIEIHPAILKYISAEMDFQIYTDRKALLLNSAYDYSGAEISKYFKMIALEIKKSQRITDCEINELISKAVTFNINFSVKPNETLINLIFDTNESRTSEEIVLLLDYPYYFGYIRQILNSYINKKQLLTLEKQELEFLLTKIDSELISTKPNEIVNNALDAMADFFNIGAVLRSQIPPQAVELYLAEKKLDDYSTRLQNALAHSPKAKYEIDEIKKIIYTVPTAVPQKTIEPEKGIEPKETETENQLPGTEVSENLAPEISAASNEDLFSNSIMTENTEETELDDFEVMTPNDEEPLDLSDELDLEEDIETFELEGDELEAAAVPETADQPKDRTIEGHDILSFLSDKETEKIINTVFNEDREDFATTIESIAECKTYEKATEILRTLYTTYNVNPYSRDAILLTNAVAKYFTNA